MLGRGHARPLAVRFHRLGDLIGELLRVERRAALVVLPDERDAALDAALELAHVERPVVVQERDEEREA